jgi:uncharacterized protein
MEVLSEGSEIARLGEFVTTIENCPWMRDVLDIVGSVGSAECWIGAGAVRDIVWGGRFSAGFEAGAVNDVDVVFFDVDDLSPYREHTIEVELSKQRPDVPWQVKNQAAVHLWYERRFGAAVPAVSSVYEAVSCWPEYATCVAVRRENSVRLRVIAPYGLDDLLDGVWRRNPRRAPVDQYRRRLAEKKPGLRWPGIRIVGA